MTSVSKNVYIDKLDDIINKYYNTYSTNKMKSVDVKSNAYIDSKNNKDPKFKIGDIVRILKYKNIFAKRLCSKLVWRTFYYCKNCAVDICY